MKKNVIVFGSVAGLIVSFWMAVSTALCNTSNPNFDASMYVGYAAMLLAFSFIFIGIKNMRDKYNGGVISFGKAFKTGLYITLIASSIYVIVWLVEYYCFFPNFMDVYTAHELKKAQASGISGTEMTELTRKMDGYKEMYKNPLFIILFTYMEILPVGLLVTLISALILKRKATPATESIK